MAGIERKRSQFAVLEATEDTVREEGSVVPDSEVRPKRRHWPIMGMCRPLEPSVVQGLGSYEGGR